MLMRVCRVLSCQQTEYEISGRCCSMCPPGEFRVHDYCTEFTTTSCVPCVEGTYNEKYNGVRNCAHCSLCSGLKVKLECTLTSDSVCEPQDGFFCLDWSSKSCGAAQKHSSCEGGQYISQRGTASTDTECSDCSTGTFSDGTGMSCQPHTQCEAENLQLIEAGTSSADARCGEQRQNVSGIVIGVLVPVVLIVGAAAGSNSAARLTKNQQHHHERHHLGQWPYNSAAAIQQQSTSPCGTHTAVHPAAMHPAATPTNKFRHQIRKQKT
uniref:TNFR-Cys domain-containing protein n=1 Tax=Oryzias melastigma TaxID=30732 RepID=A0A3B3C4G3_ORYME